MGGKNNPSIKVKLKRNKNITACTLAKQNSLCYAAYYSKPHEE